MRMPFEYLDGSPGEDVYGRDTQYVSASDVRHAQRSSLPNGTFARKMVLSSQRRSWTWTVCSRPGPTPMAEIRAPDMPSSAATYA